ncbi:hypothetical protein KIN20_006524 [Parelaphostrongylus tenuis]|uniref:Uncharacterized protein n=1 Tax=Parelaphostrongylus tenuis TaxID=148309 RepID=A0AAD5QG01_PARTN|nr:hypothetical protein KIN20_006524 [Parelaphostrongylus tenuis]
MKAVNHLGRADCEIRSSSSRYENRASGHARIKPPPWTTIPRGRDDWKTSSDHGSRSKRLDSCHESNVTVNGHKYDTNKSYSLLATVKCEPDVRSESDFNPAKIVVDVP